MSVITKQDIDKARDSLFKPAADSSGYDVIWITQDQFAGLKKVFSYMEARIAEMGKPILCAKCNDHIIADDGAVCEICADTMDTIITELQTRIAELEAALDKAAHQLYDYSGSCPSDLYDWEHPNTCIRECDRYDSPDEAWKCWRLWLMCPAPPEEK